MKFFSSHSTVLFAVIVGTLGFGAGCGDAAIDAPAADGEVAEESGSAAATPGAHQYCVNLVSNGHSVCSDSQAGLDAVLKSLYKNKEYDRISAELDAQVAKLKAAQRNSAFWTNAGKSVCVVRNSAAVGAAAISVYLTATGVGYYLSAKEAAAGGMTLAKYGQHLPKALNTMRHTLFAGHFSHVGYWATKTSFAGWFGEVFKASIGASELLIPLKVMGVTAVASSFAAWGKGVVNANTNGGVMSQITCGQFD